MKIKLERSKKLRCEGRACYIQLLPRYCIVRPAELKLLHRFADKGHHNLVIKY